MPTRAMSPADKRHQARVVGEDLVRNYGKKKYYSMFNSHGDFDDYHKAVGESCDYTQMKAEMLEALSSSSDASWFDFDLSWLEFPDIDWSVFDFFDV